MNWNYIGIDDDPPKRTKLLLLLPNQFVTVGTANHPNLVAWQPLNFDSDLEWLQQILRGLPELKMIGCIRKDPFILNELKIALLHYEESNLADFTDIIRALDKKAHNDGVPCIPHFHR